MKKFLALACCLLSGAVACADGVNVAGSGQVTANPDAASVTVAVVTKNKDARQALAANNNAVVGVLKVVEAQGVEKKDVQTSNFSLGRDSLTKDGVTVLGDFVVSNEVTVVVRKLDALGTLLNNTVTVGATNVYGVRFFCTSKDDLLDKARQAAVADATRKAKLYVETAGAKLGVVTSISERQGSYGEGAGMRASADFAPGGQVPVASGQHTFTVTVNVSWAIEK